MGTKKNTKMYSVYQVKDEMPVILYASATDCAKALGITRASFYRKITWLKEGKIKPMDYLMFENEREVMEDGR
jgi:hypothetical protein